MIPPYEATPRRRPLGAQATAVIVEETCGYRWASRPSAPIIARCLPSAAASSEPSGDHANELIQPVPVTLPTGSPISS